MLKKKLNDIFKYYKKKYRLKTKFLFEDNERCCFNSDLNKISYNLNEAKIMDCPHIKKFNQQEKLIYILLHEIGHALDWKCNRKQVLREYSRTNFFLYMLDYNYAMSLPSEKKANKFAKKELKRWQNVREI